jgi:hypothetical protein
MRQARIHAHKIAQQHFAEFNQKSGIRIHQSGRWPPQWPCLSDQRLSEIPYENIILGIDGIARIFSHHIGFLGFSHRYSYGITTSAS